MSNVDQIILIKQVQFPTTADYVTLLAFAAMHRPCGNQSISPAQLAHSSKPDAMACSGQMTGQTDRRLTVS